MKLLVVDNGQRAAARLGQALRALGQEAIISPGPAQAIEAVRHLAVDAILVDIELASMSGVDFAEALWLFVRDLPVAFRQCSGDSELIARAGEIGLLFPARWTLSDIERVVAELARRRPQRPRPQRPRPQPQRPAPAGPGSRGTWLLVPMRKVVRRIKVACRTWEQVERLCDQRDAGKDFLTLRGSHDLEPEERLSVTLHLPGALSVAIAAQVTSTRCEGSERVYVIRLVGFTPERCARLRTMAASARQPVVGAGVDRAAAAHEPAPLPEWPTRHQIERLAEKMRPSAAPSQDRSDPLAREPRGRG